MRSPGAFFELLEAPNGRNLSRGRRAASDAVNIVNPSSITELWQALVGGYGWML